MTKKWNLETSNAETGLKIGIYAKNWAKQVLLKIFDYGQSQRSTVRVNGQQMTCVDVAVWRHLGLTWQNAKHSRLVERVWARGTSAWGAWPILAARAREAGTSAGMWRRVWSCFWPFLVGFFSGLAVLSSYAFFLAVEWAKRWYPRVTGTAGVTAVARF